MLVFDRWGIKKADQAFYHDQAFNQYIHPNLTVAQNGIANQTTLYLKCGGLRGGGKRGRDTGGMATSSINIVSGLSKDDEGKKLQDVIGMTLMRCRAAQGASPAIIQVAGWKTVQFRKPNQC